MGDRKSENLRAHVIIQGLVQGVFFRASTREKALQLGVRGWVRNLPDGGVEAVFEGEKKKVEEVVAWCYKGPPGARVIKVDLAWEQYKGDLKQFDVSYRW
ncbi:MAG TPA: acylphosphatase [Nitrospirota bacterium]|nr:acylphosphatase [Nitrospirota bacterium]